MPGATRIRFNVLAASLLLVCLSIPTWAQIRFDLPAQPLAQALTSIGTLANLNVYFDPALVDGRQAPALKAELTADEALTRLLAGTRLHAVRVDENTVRVVAEPTEKRAQSVHSPDTGANYAPSNTHFAYAGGAQGVDVRAGDNTARVDSLLARDVRPISEVVVSAQKREERLLDVPVPVTALNTDVLVAQNQLRVQDYYSNVPGLNFVTDGSGNANVSIRGITTGIGAGNPTVGITVDDVPFGSSSSAAGGGPAPDIDPNDLARIEVLRGPQGTLYGASSIGGLLKFVTVDPSTQGLSGHVGASTRGVTNGPNLGYDVRGSVNVPLGDTFAARASALMRRDPGYIDNVQTGERGMNRVDVSGVRLAGLWRPTEDLSLKLSALVQHNQAHGAPDVDTGLGDLQQSYLRGAGGYDRKLQAYSAILKVKLADLDLTSVTGYNVNSSYSTLDFTPAFGDLTESGVPGTGFDGFGVRGTMIENRGRTNKFSEEIRLSSSAGHMLDWLAGLFYTHEDSHGGQKILAVDPATAGIVGSWLDATTPTTYVEYALFADATFHVTDQFDIQVGGRESKNRQTYSEVDSGLYETVLAGMPSPLVNPEVTTDDNSFTYLVTPSFKISSQLMLYARLASGYRAGGPNPTCIVFDVPCHFGPDKTQNYEIGVKGEAFDRALTFDGSVYYIDWKNIQLTIVNPTNFAFYYTNASRAKSEGVELSVEGRPWQGMTIAAWASWNEAILTEGFPPTAAAVGLPGDRLPNSARVSGHLSAEQQWAITGQVTGFVGASVSYIGNRWSYFTGGDRQIFPPYAQTDAHGGFRYATWTLNLFARNIADKRGAIGGGIGTFNPPAFQYIEPRTIGLTVDKTF